MRAELNYLVQKFFSRPDLESLPFDELEKFVQQYPYSTFGRFLLDQKKIESKTASGRQQMDSSVLYFNNPLWLNLLRQRLMIPEVVEDQAAKKLHPPELTEVMEENRSSERPEQEPEISEEFSYKADFAELRGTEEELLQEVKIPEDQLPVPLADQFERQTEAIAEDLPLPEETLSDELIEMTAKVTGTATIEEEKASTDQPSTKEDRPVFEPYHSVDYFASQGIRLQQSEFTKDRLGQQLKSFTEWIKTMKKLPEAEKQRPLDPGTEHSITQIAQISLEEREIHTEAMAEVWAKQGNKAKARMIYEKLSLQNPGKSAYFAAKIEQLNTTIG